MRGAISTACATAAVDVDAPDTYAICMKAKGTTEIVFLSAKYTEPADRAEGLLTGADAYLSKPVSLEVLWHEIRYLLDKRV